MITGLPVLVLFFFQSGGQWWLMKKMYQAFFLPPLFSKKKKRKDGVESIKTQKQYLSAVLFFLFICAALLRAVLLTWSCLTEKEHSFLLNT